MTAGYPITKADMDNRIGALIVALRDDFNAIMQFKTMLLDDTTILPDATLTSMGYTAGEITQIRSSFTSLNNLYNISKANGTQATNNDFWFDAKHLAGLNYH
jgi:hypothetical protein